MTFSRQSSSLRKIERGALCRVPGELVKDPKGLLASLTFPNPEYRNAQMFGKAKAKNGHVYTGKKIPKDLFFYSLDKRTREVLLPRNINLRKYLTAGYEFEDCTSEGMPLGKYTNPALKLRDYQEEFIESEFLPSYEAGETDFLFIADCGAGKTFTGLYAASLLKRRTLVVVTTNTIAKQWTDTVTNVYKGWTTNKLSTQKPKTDVDVVIATYSLLTEDRFDEAFFSQFGTIIFDEYHRAGAASYNEILKKAPCKYRISLTATFRRKDNLHKVLAMHVGTQLQMNADMMKARVFPIETDLEIKFEEFRAVKGQITFPKLTEFSEVAVTDAKTNAVVTRGTVYEIDRDSKLADVDGTWYDSRAYHFHRLGDVSFADIETYIAANDTRKTDLLRLIYWGRKNGRKILLLSNRKSILYDLYKSLRRKVNVGVIVSDKAKEQQRFCRALGVPAKEYEQKVKTECTVILGIDKIAKEGLDVADLDMLIYAYSEKDIEQSIGRICRNLPGKPEPLAFYFIDDSPVHKNRFYGNKGAMEMFLDLGHTVEQETHVLNINSLKI